MTETSDCLKVLVVDDEAFPHTKIRQELSGLEDSVEIVSASTVTEARALIERHFFHLAFVDLYIGKDRGVAVMRQLASHAPSCRIVLMTRFLATYASEVLEHLNGSVRIEGVVNKVKGEPIWFAPFVARMREDLDKRCLAFDGLESVVGALAGKRARIDRDLEEHQELARMRGDDAVRDEVSFLLSELFGAIGSPAPKWRARIDLRPMSRGLSSSVVVEASPGVRVDGVAGIVAGNKCVVKVGSKPEILIEADRYERVVRYGVTLEQRVELLGVATGDALGAISYSFAGGTSSDIFSLDDIMVEGDVESCLEVIGILFARSARNWYAVGAETRALRDFFRQELRAPLEKGFDGLEDWLSSLNQSDGALRVEPGRILSRDGLIFQLPDRGVLAEEGLASPVPGSLIHGDMHGGNVLVDRERGRCCLIDFRNAGLGPRLIDFAALHASVRLAHARSLSMSGPEWSKKPDNEGVARLALMVRAEAGLTNGSEAPAAESWMRLAEELDRAMKLNFSDVSGREALWTNLAYAISLFRFRRLDWWAKLRLLAWISPMVDSLSGTA